MRYTNELTVGLSVIIAAIIFILGIRYFEDLPLFRGTYELNTEFEDVNGLMNGNAVRINGVNVGAVEQVRLSPESRKVRVRFHVDEGIHVPEGSYTEIAGFGALGGVRLNLVLGPASNPPVREGAFLPSRQNDMLARLTDRAPEMLNRVDTLLLNANAAFAGADEVFADVSTTLRQADAALGEAGTTFDRAGATIGSIDRLVNDANGDLRVTLVSLRSTAAALEQILREQEARLGSVLVNFEAFSGDLSRLSAGSGDTLAVAIQSLNRVLARTEQSLETLELASANMDDILAKIDRGEGTLGLLVNDPGLYLRMDSALVSLNQILADFQNNPRRYLKELRLIDIF